MDCYTIKIYVTGQSEDIRDAVVELDTPSLSSVSCYRIVTDGEVVAVPDIRLTTPMQDASRQVLQTMLELDNPALDWRAISRNVERRNRAA